MPSPPAFRRGRILGRQAVPVLPGRRRAARPDRRGFRAGAIDYTDKIYLEFGADPKVEGVYEGPDIKDIRKRAIQAGLQLVDCPIRHLGTEKAQQLYLNIQNYLADAGVEMLFNTECENIILEDSVCKGVRLREKDGTRDVLAKQVVIATGRRGADWLENSAPSTTSPTSPAPLTSASASSAATRSWRRSTRSCTRAS